MILPPAGEYFEAPELQAANGMLSDRGNSVGQWVAVLRAAMRPEDVERLRADAELVVEQLAPGSYFRSAALHVREVAHLLACGEAAPDASAAHAKERTEGEDLGRSGYRMRLAASLTAAELRLLPLLATHLSLGAIAERLYITRNTVKTEAISTYRKLDVSSRAGAVERAIELGLIEATAATAHADPDRRPAVTQGQLSQLTLVAVVALVASGFAARTKASVRSAPRGTRIVA